MSAEDAPEEDTADPMFAVVAMIGLVATGAFFAGWLFADIPAWALVLAIPGFLGSVAYFLSSSGIAGESRLGTRAQEYGAWYVRSERRRLRSSGWGLALGVAACLAVFLIVLLYRLLGAVDRRSNLSGPPGLVLLVVVVVSVAVWLAIVVRRHRRELEADGLLRDELSADDQ